MPRGLPTIVTDELNSTTFALPIYAVRITRKDASILRWAERPVTIDGFAFEVRLMSVSGLRFTTDQAGPITIVAANIDGAITVLDRDVTFRGAFVEILAYLPTPATSYKVWIGRADEIVELNQENASINAYPSITVPNIQIPKRNISLACYNTFGNFANWNSTLDYEGSECPYRRLATIGFAALLIGPITNTATSIAVLWDSAVVTAGGKFQKGDRIKIDSESMLILNSPVDPDPVTFNQSLTVMRGELDTIPASHPDFSTVLFNNCGFAVADCLRRGMYGNNTADVYLV